MTLAILGGKPAIQGHLKLFNTIGDEELSAVRRAFQNGPLSGFLGGEKRGGYYVRELERKWAVTFGVKHAIACNSATSGLLVAAYAIGLDDSDKWGERKVFATTPFTMSATVAAPMMAGGEPYFCDVEPDTFTLHTAGPVARSPSAVFTTNLFGHADNLAATKKFCDEIGWFLIEDNAQSPFAMEGDRYAGTIGHIGVFSLNVHKHIQVGEGGIVVTHDDRLADLLRGYINHGEMAGLPCGLNLRMTEYTAAMALAQMAKAEEIIKGRIWQASLLTKAIEGVAWLTPPAVREGCSHVYYMWCPKFDSAKLGISRETFIQALDAEGFPMGNGYVKPLYHLPAFQQYARDCPVAEDLHNKTLCTFENCAYTLSADQIGQFGEAVRKIERNIHKLRGIAA